ncbi:30S ribosomal protein S12 methylthiotransferase RimO [Desulfovibrio sp. OttesenSCG-928-A18]|nr:30S ribosomal protein S12 methylthiotransferase RimO [Desulfovibrio sp. OttesenSCG-928-A18]
MTSVHSISLGCPKNRVDTEHCLGLLQALLETAGDSLRLVDAPEKAALVLINTCSFIAPAVQESVRTLLECIDRIQQLPEAERPLLAVAGCLVGRYGQKTLAPDLPEVDLFLPGAELAAWPLLLHAALRRKAARSGASPAALPARYPLEAPAYPGPLRLLSTGPSYAWLKISEGCRHSCSFCAIPAIRGPLRSVPADLLLQEAKLLLQQTRELILVAQDLTAWGADLGLKHGLISLLERLLPLPGLDRLRLMYLYPAGLSTELLRFLQQAGPPFVPYFDVPLQHASPPLLVRMGRPFAKEPERIVGRIRSFFPEAALRTSIITGFPGENEEDFELLLNFVQQSRFHHLGVFTYHAEEGTEAASMPGHVPEKKKVLRKERLLALQKEISAAILEQYQGRRMELLVDAAHAEWPGLHVARTWFQAPEVDGVTYVSGPGVVPGTLVTAEITESSDYDLVALTDA